MHCPATESRCLLWAGYFYFTLYLSPVIIASARPLNPDGALYLSPVINASANPLKSEFLTLKPLIILHSWRDSAYQECFFRSANIQPLQDCTDGDNILVKHCKIIKLFNGQFHNFTVV